MQGRELMNYAIRDTEMETCRLQRKVLSICDCTHS